MEIDFLSCQTDPRRVLPLALGALPLTLVGQDNVVPIAINDKSIVVAVSEWPQPDLFEKIHCYCNRRPVFVAVSAEALKYARARYLLAGRK